MVIFHSYVKFPEGTKYIKIREIGEVKYNHLNFPSLWAINFPCLEQPWTGGSMEAVDS